MCGFFLNFINRLKYILVEPIISYRSIEPFNIGILLGIAGLDVGNLNAMFICPFLQFMTDVFRAILTALLDAYFSSMINWASIASMGWTKKFI